MRVLFCDRCVLLESLFKTTTCNSARRMEGEDRMTGDGESISLFLPPSQISPRSSHNKDDEEMDAMCAYMQTLAMHTDDLIPRRILTEMENLENDPLDNWFACLELVRTVWNGLKASNETLSAGYRALGEEGDKEHLDAVMHRLSCTWRMRDRIMEQIDNKDDRDGSGLKLLMRFGREAATKRSHIPGMNSLLPVLEGSDSPSM